jgi:putative ABC transport system permease protein
MRGADYLQLAWSATTSNVRRTLLIMLATAIGVAAVVMLTALGEAGRRYVTGQFETLGSNLLIIMPGRNETVGGAPPMMGETPRDLTIDDALALLADAAITRVAPVSVGSAPASTAAGLERELSVLGSTAELRQVRRLKMGQGRFLPRGDPHRASAVCVLGAEAKQELFGDAPALGQWLRLADRRFRVIGVLAESGVSVGMDMDDLIIVPVAAAQALFNREGLFRVLVEARGPAWLDTAEQAIHRIVAARHEGEDDVTVITQNSVVQTLDRIIGTLTLGVAAISSISLLVAGILIMNVMLVTVAQRRAEIGLLKALGAPGRSVQRLFLLEALLLAGSGAVAGVALGTAAAWLTNRLLADFDVVPPAWAVLAALLIALASGLLSGVLPARRAAALNPIDALARR